LNTVSFVAQIQVMALQIRLDGGWVEVGRYIQINRYTYNYVGI
jgi:hypothetical protein